jgi:hypothetical protein
MSGVTLPLDPARHQSSRGLQSRDAAETPAQRSPVPLVAREEVEVKRRRETWWEKVASAPAWRPLVGRRGGPLFHDRWSPGKLRLGGPGMRCPVVNRG